MKKVLLSVYVLMILIIIVVIVLNHPKNTYNKTSNFESDKIVNSTSTVYAQTFSDWKTYTNDTYGFSFNYPKDFTLETNVKNDYGTDYILYMSSSTNRSSFYGGFYVRRIGIDENFDDLKSLLIKQGFNPISNNVGNFTVLLFDNPNDDGKQLYFQTLVSSSSYTLNFSGPKEDPVTLEIFNSLKKIPVINTENWEYEHFQNFRIPYKLPWRVFVGGGKDEIDNSVKDMQIDVRGNNSSVINGLSISLDSKTYLGGTDEYMDEFIKTGRLNKTRSFIISGLNKTVNEYDYIPDQKVLEDPWRDYVIQTDTGILEIQVHYFSKDITPTQKSVDEKTITDFLDMITLD